METEKQLILKRQREDSLTGVISQQKYSVANRPVIGEIERKLPDGRQQQQQQRMEMERSWNNAAITTRKSPGSMPSISNIYPRNGLSYYKDYGETDELKPIRPYSVVQQPVTPMDIQPYLNGHTIDGANRYGSSFPPPSYYEPYNGGKVAATNPNGLDWRNNNATRPLPKLSHNSTRWTNEVAQNRNSGDYDDLASYRRCKNPACEYFCGEDKRELCTKCFYDLYPNFSNGHIVKS